MGLDFADETKMNLKGWQFHFNSYTLRGKFNCVAATWASVFAITALVKLNKRRKARRAIEATQAAK